MKTPKKPNIVPGRIEDRRNERLVLPFMKGAPKVKLPKPKRKPGLARPKRPFNKRFM